MWKTFHGSPIPDLLEEVRALIRAGAGAIHIGTDSQIDGQGTNFVTALCVLAPGAGGRVFTKSSRQDCRMSLAQKLILEAESSLSIARDLEPHIEVPIIVHLDVNENPRHRSFKQASMLAGMVRGNGFDVKLKPEAWCATHVADHVVKRHVPRAA